MEIALKLLTSLLIGAAIGLEREIHEKNDIDTKKEMSQVSFLGIRTLSLTTARGAFAGLLYYDHLGICLAITALFGAILITHYFLIF